MRTLYFDCFAGASGNMVLGALLALGVNENDLRDGLSSLRVDGFELEIRTVDRAGIAATHVDVMTEPQKKHRHLRHIEEIIDASALSDSVNMRSKAIFRRLAEAEAKVHGTDIQKVHFHEVGAVDAIVDVVGACIGFELLGIERFVASRLNTGSGFVTMEHGTYPVPPPAVCNLLEGAPVYSSGIEGELLTPTGAAIISTLCSDYGPLPEVLVERTGYGAGSRSYEKFPNVLRLILGNSEIAGSEDGASTPANGQSEELFLLETNLDDLNPQIAAYTAERALAMGAADSWITDIQMKKGRPAVKLSILCSAGSRQSILEMIYGETTTLGVRISKVERHSLPRQIATVETRFGPIRIKRADLGGRTVNVMPEYDDVRNAAILHGVPFQEVQSEAIAAADGRTRSAAGAK